LNPFLYTLSAIIGKKVRNHTSYIVQMLAV
jgi:hypothetical protein